MPKNVADFVEQLKNFSRDSKYLQQDEAKPDKARSVFATSVGDPANLQGRLASVEKELHSMNIQQGSNSAQNQSEARFISGNRTPSGAPICNYCRKPGHIARYCRNRSGNRGALNNRVYQGSDRRNFQSHNRQGNQFGANSFNRGQNNNRNQYPFPVNVVTPGMPQIGLTGSTTPSSFAANVISTEFSQGGN